MENQKKQAPGPRPCAKPETLPHSRGSTRVNVYNNSTRQSAPLEIHTAHDDHLLPLNILASCIFLPTHLLTIVIPFQVTYFQHGKRPLFSGRTQAGGWEHRSRSQPGLAPGFLHCVGFQRRSPCSTTKRFPVCGLPSVPVLFCSTSGFCLLLTLVSLNLRYSIARGILLTATVSRLP